MRSLIEQEHGLWERLESATSEQQRRIELSPFFQDLFFCPWRGGIYAEIARASEYVLYLHELRGFYRALEHALELASLHPVIRELSRLRVHRSRALEADLTRFVGAVPAHRPPSGTVQGYRQRVMELAQDAPTLLAGHVYAQQKLDVLRGPMLRARVQQTFDLGDSGAGVAFYEDSVDRGSVYACFDLLPMSAQEGAEVVVEARLVFRIRELMQQDLLRQRWGLRTAD